MKSITSILVFSSAAYIAQCYSSVGTLNEFYSKYCTGYNYFNTTGNTQINYEPWEFMKGFALGTQVEILNTDSTCYGQVNQTFDFINNIVDSGYSWAIQILNFNFSTSSANAQNMFQNLNNFVIQLSDQTIACQDPVKIKQLQTRTNKISGFTNWAFTLAYGFLFDYIKGNLAQVLPERLIPKENQKVGDAGKSIYNKISNFATDPSNKIDCWELGRQVGLFVSETLEAKVDSKVPLVEAQKLQ